MIVKVGDLVVTFAGFGYCVKRVTGRTASTIATSHLNGSRSDFRADLYSFRAYDKAKIDRILQVEEHIKGLYQEQKELYQSLERLE